MKLLSCIAVIPSADLEKSMRFWVEGLGLAASKQMEREGRLIGCMVSNEHVCFWLNESDGTQTKPENYEGIRLYWWPDDIHATRDRLKQVGFEVSEIEEREYGQTEFFVTDDDGHSHCFGVTAKALDSPVKNSFETTAGANARSVRMNEQQ